ncbi:MAG: ABC transporter ATP-binding protein [Clostridia bacterium]|nr:ABC transporter ATP-binding protein [Clostridia bacterium]
MSKQSFKATEAHQQRRNTQKDRIPEMERLFGYGETKDTRKEGYILKLLRKDWKSLLITTFIYFLQASPVWLIPLITSDVIDVATARPDGYVRRLFIEGIFAVLIIFQNIFSTAWRSSIVNKRIRSTMSEIRSGVIRKLQRLSITYHREIEEGKIQSKFLRDIDSVEVYYRTIVFSFLPAIIGTIVSIGISLYKNAFVTLFFLLVIPINVLVMLGFRRAMRKERFQYRMENENLSSKVTTALQMMMITKAHGLVAGEGYALGQRIDLVKTAGLRMDKTEAWFGSFMWVIGQILSVGCLFFCVFLALKGHISIGEVVLFQSLFVSINGSIQQLIALYPTIASGGEALRSLSEIMHADDIERDGGKLVKSIKGDVDFCKVSYHYPNESKAVIQDFDLHVKKGERIAIVGSSGSGKSTIMNLLIGLLSPTEGRILIDGKPLDEISLQEYRRFLSVVPQNSILFSGTIRENITYGLDSYTEKQLQKAIEDASITEFLPSLPKGLDSQVGERGDKLSGGQRQRVSIARALIRNPKILIMDEATSALDNVAEFHVQQAIERLVKNRTTFVVAHRLSTIRNADRIVVMEEGKMVEVGSYEELMSLGGRFSELERLSRLREEQVQQQVI